MAEIKSYLDDPNHNWDSIERGGDPGWHNLNNQIADLHERDLPEDTIAIILRGYAGLKQRHPDEEDGTLLHTSMVWMFG